MKGIGRYPQNVQPIIGGIPVSADAPLPVDAILAGGNYAHIAGSGTNIVKSGGGVLVRLAVNTAISTSTITIYDNTAGSGTVIAAITNPLSLVQTHFSLEFGLLFTTGLTIVTSGADDITVVYR